MLSEFIATRCFVDASLRVRLQSFREAYLLWLPEGERRHWPRSRVKQELQAAGYLVARGGDRRCYVAGIGLDPPRIWSANRGLLSLVPKH
jgi:hypothetical protein